MKLKPKLKSNKFRYSKKTRENPLNQCHQCSIYNHRNSCLKKLSFQQIPSEPQSHNPLHPWYLNSKTKIAPTVSTNPQHLVFRKAHANSDCSHSGKQNP